MTDLEEFRASVRSWLEENSPKSLRGKIMDPMTAYWGGKKSPLPHPDSKIWLEMMAERGGPFPSGPKSTVGAVSTKRRPRY